MGVQLLTEKAAGLDDLILYRIFGDTQAKGYFFMRKAFNAAETEYKLTLRRQHVQYFAFHPLQFGSIYIIFSGIGSYRLMAKNRLPQILVQRSFFRILKTQCLTAVYI